MIFKEVYSSTVLSSYPNKQSKQCINSSAGICPVHPSTETILSVFYLGEISSNSSQKKKNPIICLKNCDNWSARKTSERKPLSKWEIRRLRFELYRWVYCACKHLHLDVFEIFEIIIQILHSCNVNHLYIYITNTFFTGSPYIFS